MARWAYDNSKESFIISCCIDEIRGSSEVLINYGGKANYRMFSWYGFCMDREVEPPASKVEIPLRGHTFSVNPDPEQFVEDISFILKYVRHRSNLKELIDEPLIQKQNGLVNIIENEINAFKAIEQVISSKMNSFQRTLEEDLREFHQSIDEKRDEESVLECSFSRRNTLLVLIAEKKMLQFIIDFSRYSEAALATNKFTSTGVDQTLQTSLNCLQKLEENSEFKNPDCSSIESTSCSRLASQEDNSQDFIFEHIFRSYALNELFPMLKHPDCENDKEDSEYNKDGVTSSPQLDPVDANGENRNRPRSLFCFCNSLK
jgi:hypothetical protein